MKRSVRIAAVLGLAVAVGFGVSAAASADQADPHHFAATAVAIPATPGAQAQADTTRFDRAETRTGKVDGVATTSLTCDGCTGKAQTLQVVYLTRNGTFTADNVAAAWASGCTGCAGWSLSLQVVLARATHQVTAANRALALNASCVNCSTAAAAIQIVVVAPSGRRLSPKAIASVYALRQQLVAELSASPAPAQAQAQAPGQARAQATPAAPSTTARVTATTNQIQSVLSADLQATSASHDVKVTR